MFYFKAQYNARISWVNFICPCILFETEHDITRWIRGAVAFQTSKANKAVKSLTQIIFCAQTIQVLFDLSLCESKPESIVLDWPESSA